MAISAVRVASFAAFLMCVVSVAANGLKPVHYLSDTRPIVKMATVLPEKFGDWSMEASGGGVVNPQQEEVLNRLYSEIVNRTYVDRSGYRIMLSVAYGKNQNDSLQVHKPERCYPAQGFRLLTSNPGRMALSGGSIPVHRLETEKPPTRVEPVTYWVTIGDETVRDGLDKKLKEARYALKGYIADGLLFRVSSIDADTSRAFLMHEKFASDLFAAVNASDRKRVFGLM